jgi:probable 2-oxoglutarate dehydrogenase E1 component DHKTD1
VGSGTHVVADGTAFGGKWRAVRQGASDEMFASPATGVDVQVLREVGRASVTLPAGFAPHDRLVRGHVLPRLAALGYAADGNVDAAAESAALAGPTLDWATAEALAFGSLLAQGHDVRLSGQDAQRGTFSHRHAMFVDQRSGAKVNPLHEGVAAGAGSGAPRTAANNAAGPGRFSVVSSLLSEFGVLGFEYGYSWENPDPLVLWEAQFGDFSNGAQIIIDQFISGGESKWLRQSGLVMLLPHGYDGAGPEHSSARIERFLQLVNSQAVTRMAPAEYARMALEAGVSDKTIAEAHNMVVANPTTPANYFHLLRRQVGRPFRKPLVVVGPKTLLRHPAAKSALADLAPGTGFQPVLTEGAGGDGAAPAAGPNRDIKRVLLVSGKLHLELAARRAAASSATAKETAIVRVEELAPFPTAAIMATLQERYPALGRVDWVQEEPANAGAWTWAEAHMAPALQAAGLPALRYFGRPALAAPAVGLSKLNKLQQEALLKAALP